jgi:hypothetical protein
LGTPEGPRRSPPRPNHSEKHGRRGPGAFRPLAYLHPSSRSEPLLRPPCERGANTSPTTSVHTRATFRRQILEVCAAFVAAKARAYPRFPRRNHGKEGVDGSSPSEGLPKVPANRQLCCCLSAEHADTFRTHLRYARRTATSGVVFRHVCDKAGRQVDQEIPPLRSNFCRPGWRDLDPFPAERGSGMCVPFLNLKRRPCHAGCRGFESRRSRKRPAVTGSSVGFPSEAERGGSHHVVGGGSSVGEHVVESGADAVEPRRRPQRRRTAQLATPLPWCARG